MEGDEDQDDAAALVAAVEDERTDPEDAHAALTRLLELDPRLGAQTALGVLAGQPRIKPSTGLLVDPGDTVMRRWRRRVAAGRALIASPVLSAVFDEIYDELTDCRDFTEDVLIGAKIAENASDAQRKALAALLPQHP